VTGDRDILPPGDKLNLGCGPVQPEGWVNVDGSNRAWLAGRFGWLDRLLVRLSLLAPTEFGPQVRYADLFKPLPFADGAVSCIYAGELWEHFEYDDAARLTRECYRVLAPGGVLRVRVPDGRTFAARLLGLIDEQLAAPRDRRSAAAIRAFVAEFFQDVCTRRVRFGFMGHFHKWLFDEVQLAELLETAGFTQVQRRAYHDSRIPHVEAVEVSPELIVEGVKPEPPRN